MEEQKQQPHFTPENAEQLKDAIQWAISERRPLCINGLGTKRDYGHAVDAKDPAFISLAALNGITAYEPAELVMTAKAGTPLAEIEETLAQNNQMLAFEPIHLEHILGTDETKEDAEKSGTIGSVFACNLSGPRRLNAGAARDHLLGFQAVSGRGEFFKSGGQVMKNVTGYDLSKLMTGSMGSLAIMHEVSFKVLPKPEASHTLIVSGTDHVTANKIMTEAMNSNADVASAAWIPANFTKKSAVKVLALAGQAVTACRIEGPIPSVKKRVKDLRDKFATLGKIEELHTENSDVFWREIRDLSPLSYDKDQRVLWKISVPPASGAAVIEALGHLKHTDFMMDWAGGLVWLAIDAPTLGAEEHVRKVALQFGGHATLMRGPAGLKANIDVFQPQAKTLAALSQRIKDQFDPFNLINPGRIHPNLNDKKIHQSGV